jgi:acetyl esterase/lipase
MSGSRAADDGVARRVEVIYGRKFGTALTLDVLTPPKINGYGVCLMVSGGFFSSHDAIQPAMFRALLDRGYTVFAVVHGSQPRFVIPEIEDDVQRAVRFVRHHAADYGVRPDQLGVTGASAGGHLSLMLGGKGGPGDPAAKDPIDRESSAVQAVACFFPPVDYLNWNGVDAVGVGPLAAFKPAFGARSDTAEGRAAYGKEISPINYVTASLPPTLIIHGEADTLVPIQQAEIFLEKCKAAGVRADVKVDRRPGLGHGWKGIEKDFEEVADWFDAHLRGTGRK